MPVDPQHAPCAFEPLPDNLKEPDLQQRITRSTGHHSRKGTYMPGGWLVDSPPNPPTSIFGGRSSTPDPFPDIQASEQLRAEAPPDVASTDDAHPDQAEDQQTHPEDPAESKIVCS